MASIWLGTSGFSYKEWKPVFYPQDLSDKQFLQYYATKLNSVEIDYTFYRMPNAKTIEGWRNATPENFRFTLKASNRSRIGSGSRFLLGRSSTCSASCRVWRAGWA